MGIRVDYYRIGVGATGIDANIEGCHGLSSRTSSNRLRTLSALSLKFNALVLFFQIGGD